MKRNGGEPLTYLYAVVRAPRAPKLGPRVRPLPSMGPPRAIAAGERTWLVASDAEPEAYSARAIEVGLRDIPWVSACATAHEAIVEALARVGTVVPMRLFTLFASDARALEHVGKAKRSIERTLARIDACDEWSVRVLYRADRAEASATKSARAETRGMSAGAGFLMRKKMVQEAQTSGLARARDEAEALFEAVAGLARDAQRRTPAQDDARARVLLDAVLLVPRAKAARVKSTAAKASSRLLASGFEVVVSGPWPAYHFVTS